MEGRDAYYCHSCGAEWLSGPAAELIATTGRCLRCQSAEIARHPRATPEHRGESGPGGPTDPDQGGGSDEDQPDDDH